jgi:hypothetical protein
MPITVMASRMNGKASCVGQAHDRVIGRAAPHAGEEAERCARDAGQEHRRESDETRGSRPVDQAAQYVAAELIGAQDGQRAVGGPS